MHCHSRRSPWIARLAIDHLRTLAHNPLICVFDDRLWLGVQLDSLADIELESICGLTRGVFLHLYRKYCGATTIIRNHTRLLRIFAYMKLYPTGRQTRVFAGCSIHTIKKGIMYLAGVIDELSEAWEHRQQLINLSWIISFTSSLHLELIAYVIETTSWIVYLITSSMD